MPKIFLNPVKKWIRDLNRHFFKENIETTNRNIKRYSTSLIIWEIQIKTTMRCHLALIRMPIINKSTNNKCQWGCGKSRILLHCWWECRLVQPLWKAVWSYLQILKIELPYDPVIPLLEIYPKKPKTLIQKNISSPMFIVALLTVAKI